MKIKPYIDKLNASKTYRDFQKKYSDAFMIAGFFIIDMENKQNMHQIDYYVPSEKKIAAFTLDGGVTMQILEAVNHGVPEKLDMGTKIDLDALPGILEDEMKNRSMTEEIKKIIAIVQTIDGKKVWNLNCVLSGMEILKAHIEDESQTVLKMEKISLADIMKKLPSPQLQALQKGAPGEEESPQKLKAKIKKLKQLESAIEKEEKVYEEELKKKTAKKEKKAKSPQAEAASSE
jgi:hypothetical protein